MAVPSPSARPREGLFHRLHVPAIVLGVLLAALVPRLENASRAFRDGWLQIAPFDELYHARRILLAAERPRDLLEPDPLRGAHGGFCPWPPLYDLSAGRLARLLGGASPAQVLRTAAFVPPLVASVVAALLALAVARGASPAAGLVAGLGFAWAPVLVGAARVGAIDHHFLEGPLVLLLLATLLPLVRDGAAPRMRHAAALAGALLLALLVQTALVLFAGAALLVLLGTAFDRPASLRAAAGGFAAAGLGVLAFRALQPPGYPDSAWFLGTAHAALLLGAGLSCAVAAVAGARGRGLLVTATAGLAAGALLVAAVPGALPALVEGSGFLGGSAWFASIQEFRPLVGPGTDFAHVLSLVGGGAALALPLLLIGIASRDRVLSAAGAFAFLTVAAALARGRLAVIAAPAGALAAALVFHVLRVRGRTWLALGVGLASLLPGALGTVSLVRSRTPQIPPAAGPFLATAQALRSQPPRDGAVLGPWAWGHALGVGSGRRVLVDNFGLIGDRTLFEDAVLAPYLPGEGGLALLCARTGTRFVVVTDSLSAVATHVATAGRKPESYLAPGAPGQPPRPTRLLAASFWFRANAAHEGGARIAGAPPSPFRRFRLVSVTGGGPLPRVQTWEYLPD